MSDNRDQEEIRGPVSRLLIGMLHRYFLLSRGLTLGVRAACFDQEGRVFLVRHTYIPGWYLPGGGVERRETALEALERELAEEGNLTLIAPPQLFQVYFNKATSPRDHVLLYRAEVTQGAPRVPDREIAESGFFSLDALPAGTTPATLRRLKEVGGECPPAGTW